MERVYKGVTGYSKEKDGKPATHVILTIDEYNLMLSNLRNAKNETQSTIEKANKAIGSYKQQAIDTVTREKEESQKRIETLQNDLNKAEVEIHRLNDLNANMLRIAKERANAKRGLTPKKTHHGYLVLDSSQYNYVFRYWVQSKGHSDDFSCWKVRIQSPYDSSISYETIIKDIHDDLVKIFGSALGLSSICDVTKLKYKDFKERWESNKNFIFKTSYKANIKSGFWEIEYLVKSSIIVPEDMRTA